MGRLSAFAEPRPGVHPNRQVHAARGVRLKSVIADYRKKAPLQAKRQAHPCLPFCLPLLFVFVFRTEEFMINRLSSSVRRASSDSRVIKALPALSRSPSLPMISSRWAAAYAFFVAKLPTEPFRVCAALPNAPASPQRIAFLIFARP